MKFRKLLLSTVLAASQIATVLPSAGAENGSGDTVTQQTYGQGDASSSGTSASDTQNPGQQAGSQQTDSQQAEQETQNSSQTEAISPSTSGQAAQSAESAVSATYQSALSADQLILILNSNLMYQGGIQYKAAEPMTVKNGVSYVAIRSLVDRAGLAIRYDSATKETVITRGADELRFKLNSNTYKVNGVIQTMKGKSYSTKKNVFMVPFTSITAALHLPYTLDLKAKKITLTVSTKPVAKFTVGPSEIVAGETRVNYITSSFSPTGQSIVNEEWTGREEIFSAPGSYVVTYRVQDASGQWSDPYVLTINVVKPHTPPVAAFTTDKDTYRMGEKITYTNQSTDEENSIVKVQWENNKLAFFEPGPQTIRLKVTNKYGLSSTVERTVNITGETLYNESDFNQLFVPVGDKYTFDGTQVPGWAKVNYTFSTEPVTLIRSNSPETTTSEGILYSETSVGRARFMIHHANETGKDVRMYVIATNTNDEAASLYIDSLGFAGPNENATATGKLSAKRYFTSIQTRSAEQDITLAPRESKVIFSELSAGKMKLHQVISLLSDIYTDYPIQFDVIMIDANKDPIATLPTLSVLPRDGVHNRGTYPDATRIIQYDELLGDVPKRLLIGDNVSDPFQSGIDTPNYTEAKNAGNFGVFYKIKATNVAPHTLITFNPRGGTYSGAIMVNGMIVDLPVNGVLNAPNDTAVLYRTGDTTETVDFLFTAAPGSNLSINLLFQPLPEMKAE
ncbi:stalk domain-containing protein [Paenibacillus caui]|uniref:stalk domain-containing protein n=1 Tax=Paenibacillus caui TaxID=2873927 RepID=UPI001CA8064C|nr:stalk domain-containing protein [Paenibacillus caui]